MASKRGVSPTMMAKGLILAKNPTVDIDSLDEKLGKCNGDAILLSETIEKTETNTNSVTNLNSMD